MSTFEAVRAKLTPKHGAFLATVAAIFLELLANEGHVTAIIFMVLYVLVLMTGLACLIGIGSHVLAHLYHHYLSAR